MADVYNEFNERLSLELNIKNFRTRKVVKNFAFSVPDVDVPVECEYLEVRFSGKTLIPSLKKEYSTIAHIFGVNTSPIETFLLERKIKGPKWLEISHFKPTKAPLSWTKVEVTVPDMKYVTVAKNSSDQPPPLVVCALKVESITNVKNDKNEIVMISLMQHSNYSLEKENKQLITKQFCGVTRPGNKNWPFDIQQKLQQYKKFKIFKHDSERFLLQWFLSIYQVIFIYIYLNLLKFQYFTLHYALGDGSRHNRHSRRPRRATGHHLQPVDFLQNFHVVENRPFEDQPNDGQTSGGLFHRPNDLRCETVS